MPWQTSESPLPQVEIHPCEKAGCRALARNHFLSVRTDSGFIERRIAKRCDQHAEELRATIEKRAVAVARAPKPVQEPIDPVAQLLEPKPAEKPKRAPQVFTIPGDVTPTLCESCGETIVFVPTAREKLMPVEAFGEHRGHSHFIYCTHANQHRKPR